MAVNAESGDNSTALLKTLPERFNSLECEVKTLKEKKARRSASAEAETSTGSEGSESRRLRSKSRRSDAQRRRRRTPSSSSEDGSSRSRSPRRKRKQEVTVGDTVGSRSRSPPRRKRSRKGKSPARTSSRSLADRMSDSEEERMDYTREVCFSESEAEDQPRSKVMEVSERTHKFLQEKCTRRVPNSERREIREKFPLPKVPATRPAQLDPMLKPKASQSVKAVDKQLTQVPA